MISRFFLFISVIALVFFSGCKNNSDKQKSTDDSTTDSLELEFSDDQAGLSLPDNFDVLKVAEDVGQARRIEIRENGDMYVSLNSKEDGHALLAMRDTSGNGKADIKEYFGDITSGTGLRIHNDYLYFGSDTAVVRYKLDPDKLVPEEKPELIASLPDQSEHEARSLAFDDQDNMFVNIGVPSNSCQEEDRKKGSMGQDPCPLLEKYGGIWKFDAETQNQTHEDDGERFVTGVRNTVALDWNPHSKKLYGVMHGRDQLYQDFGEYYDQEESAELPAEEFLLFKEDADYGWPYVFWNHHEDVFEVAPEYGGDGKKTDEDSDYEEPIMAFPAHWAPNGLLFYTGNQFPDEYKNGAFVAFHGSWNRAPEPQKGFNVVFVPFDGDLPSDDYEIFADDFAATSDPIKNPGDAKHRPNGLSQGPDGSLYITDDKDGTIFRVVYNKEDQE